MLGESLSSFLSTAILLLLNLCLSNQGLGDLSVLHGKLHRLPQWLSNKQSTCSEELQATTGLNPGSERSPGGRHGNSLQYSCLESPMDRGA